MEALHDLSQHIDRYCSNLVLNNLFEGWDCFGWIRIKHFCFWYPHAKVIGHEIRRARGPRNIAKMRNNMMWDKAFTAFIEFLAVWLVALYCWKCVVIDWKSDMCVVGF